jgi:WD40 repeat protein
VAGAFRYKLLRTLTGHTRSIVSVKFSSDGALLASGSADKTVRLWDPETGEQLRVLEGHTQARPYTLTCGHPYRTFGVKRGCAQTGRGIVRCRSQF